MKKETVYLILCISALFPATSCTDETAVSEYQSADTSPTAMLAVAAKTVNSFPPHQAFYSNLLSRSSCELLKFKNDTITGPVNCSEFKSSISEFGHRYSVDGTLEYFPTKISIDDPGNDLIDLIETISREDRFGLVFHYGYDEANGTGKIVYILSKGTLENNTAVQFCPFDSGENNQNTSHFLLLEPTGNKPFKAIDQTRFDTYTREYFEKMRYNSAPLVANTHAKMVYHEPDSLLMFYNAFDDLSDLHLYINHGTVPSKSGNLYYHAPILTIGDQNIFYEIDDTGRTPNVFLKKALDIGQLCPPSCAVSPLCP